MSEELNLHMRVIHKQRIFISDRQTLELPYGSEILKFDNQNGELCVWYSYHPDMKEKQYLVIKVIGTGHVFNEPPDEMWSHMATVVMNPEAPFVWHIYKVEPV